MTTPFKPDIQKLSALPFHESLTMLIYGPSGSGKTYFAGTAGPRSVILNAGAGLTTLVSPAFRTKFPYDPYIINIPLVAQPYDYLIDSVNWAVQNLRAEFDVMVFDEFTAIRRMAMRKALQINADLNKSDTESKMKKNRGVMSPMIADYGEEMNVIAHCLDNITQLAKANNFHLLCLAHERITMGKAPSIGAPRPEVKVRPGFTGETFPDAVPGYFDAVWRLEVLGKGANKVRRFTTDGNEKVQAKTRHGGVFSEFENNLTFPDVVQRIKSHKYIVNPDDPTLLIRA